MAADPLTLAVTVGGLVQQAGAAALAYRSIKQKYKDAPRSLALISAEIDQLRQTLISLRTIIQEHSEVLAGSLDNTHSTLTQSLDVQLTACHLIFNTISTDAANIDKYYAKNGIVNRQQKMRMTWNDDWLRDVTDRTGRLRASMQLLLDVINCSLALAQTRSNGRQQQSVQVRFADEITQNEAHLNNDITTVQDTVSVLSAQDAREGSIFQPYAAQASILGDDADAYTIASGYTAPSRHFVFDDEILQSTPYKQVAIRRRYKKEQNYGRTQDSTVGQASKSRKYIFRVLGFLAVLCISAMVFPWIFSHTELPHISGLIDAVPTIFKDKFSADTAGTSSIDVKQISSRSIEQISSRDTENVHSTNFERTSPTEIDESLTNAEQVHSTALGEPTSMDNAPEEESKLLSKNLTQNHLTASKTSWGASLKSFVSKIFRIARYTAAGLGLCLVIWTFVRAATEFSENMARQTVRVEKRPANVPANDEKDGSKVKPKKRGFWSKPSFMVKR